MIKFDNLDLIIELSRNFVMASGQKSFSNSLLRRPDEIDEIDHWRGIWKDEKLKKIHLKMSKRTVLQKRQKNQITDLNRTLTHCCGGLRLLGNFPQSEKVITSRF